MINDSWRKVVCLLPLILILLSGCDRDGGTSGVQAYNVPKEQQPPVQAAHNHNPHGEGMPGKPMDVIFQLPANWKEQSGDAMRAARLLVPGKDGFDADVSILTMPNMKASREEIINIWRQQLKLAPIDKGQAEKTAEKVKVGKLDAELYDLASEESLIENKMKVRILVAMLEDKGMSWFIKMTGPDDLVKETRPAFVDFLKTVVFREPAPETPAMQVASTVPGGPKLELSPASSWQPPTEWKQQEPGQMLAAKYAITGEGNAQAEVTVSVLSGEAGGLLANVNRWRGQLSLPPINADELPKVITTFPAGKSLASMADLKGTSAKSSAPARMLVVSIPHAGQTMFFKLMGDEKVVESQKENFLAFVKSSR